MAFLAVPQPFDFELTTERFRVFGPDPREPVARGGLHRVVGGREFGRGAPGGVDVEPLDEETGRVVLKLLGAEFDLAGFEPDLVLAPEVARLRGSGRRSRPSRSRCSSARSRRSRSR